MHRFPQNIEAAQIFSANQYIRMISEGYRDTDDWSNNAENTALHQNNKLHFKIYSNRKCVL